MVQATSVNIHKYLIRFIKSHVYELTTLICQRRYVEAYIFVAWHLRRPKSPASRLFLQELVRANNIEKKLRITGSLWVESTHDRWIAPVMSKAENITISWRHRVHSILLSMRIIKSFHGCFWSFYQNSYNAKVISKKITAVRTIFDSVTTESNILNVNFNVNLC